MNANKIRQITLFVLSIFYFGNINSQMYVKGVPYLIKHKELKRNIQKKILTGIDVKKLKDEDKKEEKKDIPPRFGYPYTVNYTLENSGTWTILDDGSRLWELSIECPKALSINILYDKFWLPDSSKLFIYNRDTTQIIGAFTCLNNSGSRERPDAFATGLVYGDKITLEYFEPKSQIGKGVISISRIIHGYRYIRVSGNNNDKDYGDAGNCNINVNCPEGANWQTEKRGVALIIVNGTRWCSGCLINNANQDETPYL